MSEHRPRVGDAFWDGQVKPQPNGRIVYIEWLNRSVVVEFYADEGQKNSYHRASYEMSDIAPYWNSKRNYYKLNEADFLEGFKLDHPVKPPKPTDGT